MALHDQKTRQQSSLSQSRNEAHEADIMQYSSGELNARVPGVSRGSKHSSSILSLAAQDVSIAK